MDAATDYLAPVLARLEPIDRAGYHAGAAAATEPMALAALALAAHDRLLPAKQLAIALCDLQQPDGNVGTRAEEKTPWWATGWAVLAWSAVNQRDPDPKL